MTKKTGPESPLRLEFGYDERSRRITKRVLTGSNYETLIETRRFIWDGWLMAGEVIEKGSSTETKTYLWGWDVSGSEEGAGGVGGLIAVHNTSGVYFPIYDGNGNTRHLWGATEGTVVDSADYGPFGELTQSPTTDHSPFWFSSKYWDQESGFLYYGYRFYNPETGRWLNRDPIGERGGINLFGAIYNAPTDSIDTDGRFVRFAPKPVLPTPPTPRPTIPAPRPSPPTNLDPVVGPIPDLNPTPRPQPVTDPDFDVDTEGQQSDHSGNFHLQQGSDQALKQATLAIWRRQAPLSKSDGISKLNEAYSRAPSRVQSELSRAKQSAESWIQSRFWQGVGPMMKSWNGQRGGRRACYRIDLEVDTGRAFVSPAPPPPNTL
jgi:RHS repeat-associated protein